MLRHEFTMADLDGSALQVFGNIIIVARDLRQGSARIMRMDLPGQAACPGSLLSVVGRVMHLPAKQWQPRSIPAGTA